MKYLLLFSILITTQFVSTAQSSFEYGYDVAGNRTQRTVIVLDPTREAAPFTDLKSGYSFEVFPNPTTDAVTITLASEFLSLPNKVCEIVDLNGTIIQKIQPKGNQLLIDLSNQAAGTYLIILKADGAKGEWKVVKL